jgi:hypothetical protein
MSDATIRSLLLVEDDPGFARLLRRSGRFSQGPLGVMFGDVADSDPRDEAADRGVRTSVIVEVDEPRERQEAPGV